MQNKLVYEYKKVLYDEFGKRLYPRHTLPFSSKVEVPFVSYNINDMIKEYQSMLNIDNSIKVSINFRQMPTLASIHTENKDIMIHTILNNSETPQDVIAYIIKHELLHLIISPRMIDGKMTSHPPEFYEEQTKISPEGDEIFFWLFRKYFHYLKQDNKAECIYVLYKFPKRKTKYEKMQMVPWDKMYI